MYNELAETQETHEGRMDVVNLERLRAALKQRGITIEQTADALNVNPSTLYRRFNRQGEKFTVDEVSKLAAMLDLSSERLSEIFFDD